MLPSTFEDKLKKEEQLKKRLTAKLEIAQFLQDTVAVMAQDLKQRETGELKASADDLYQFMKDVSHYITPAATTDDYCAPQIRRGAAVHNEDIIRFAQLFKDEFTLDNLDRVYLSSMCQVEITLLDEFYHLAWLWVLFSWSDCRRLERIIS